jgi:hypothetical protein
VASRVYGVEPSYLRSVWRDDDYYVAECAGESVKTPEPRKLRLLPDRPMSLLPDMALGEPTRPRLLRGPPGDVYRAGHDYDRRIVQVRL